MQNTIEISSATNARQADSEQNSNTQPQNTKKHRTPRVKMNGAAHSSRGWNRPHIA
jgi:hypothetical protein